jgi:hypothetical protein
LLVPFLFLAHLFWERPQPGGLISGAC